MLNYILINSREELEDQVDTLRQLQEDIPESNGEFKKIDKIIKCLKKALLELE